MKNAFTLNLDGVDYQIEVDGNTFIVNGHPFVIGFEEEKVTVDGIAYDITLDGDTAIVEGIARSVRVSGLDVEPTSTRAAAPTPAAAGVGAVRAIMPGTIVRVLAEQGETVTAGEVLLVLEAMKMENELHAPVSGVVKGIFVQPGDAVEMNALLAEVEPLS